MDFKELNSLTRKLIGGVVFSGAIIGASFYSTKEAHSVEKEYSGFLHERVTISKSGNILEPNSSLLRRFYTLQDVQNEVKPNGNIIDKGGWGLPWVQDDIGIRIELIDRNNDGVSDLTVAYRRCGSIWDNTPYKVTDSIGFTEYLKVGEDRYLKRSLSLGELKARGVSEGISKCD